VAVILLTAFSIAFIGKGLLGWDLGQGAPEPRGIS